MSGRSWPSWAFLSTYRSQAQSSLCLSCADFVLSWFGCSVTVSLPSAPLSPSGPQRYPEIFLCACPPPTFMSAFLPSTVVSVQKVRIFPFGTLACVTLFCFALQHSTCLSREKPQNCGDETSCTEKEADQPGCPEGRDWAEFALEELGVK